MIKNITDTYKQTDWGILPQGWNCEVLKGKIVITHGFGFQSQYFNSQGLYRLTTPGHFYEEGGFRDVGEKQKYYDGLIPDGYLLQAKDLIVAMTEQADGLLGSAAIIPESGNYLHNQRLGKVKPISSDIELDFLYYIFNSKKFRLKVRETAAGTKVKHTSPNKLLEIAVPIPPLPEQKAIAQSLSDVDALITECDRIITKKRNTKQGTMQQLLTGKKRLPGFSGEWEVKKLGELLKFKNGVNAEKKHYGKGIKFINILEVIQKNSLFYDDIPGFISLDAEAIKSNVVKKGDVLFNRTSETQEEIGLTAVYLDKKEVVFGGFVIRARPINNLIDCYFSKYAFSSLPVRNQIIKKGQGAVRANIGQSDLKEVFLFLPPLPEQKAIAQVLSDMDAEIAGLEQKRDKYKAIKQGMMQELLTGKTRLIGIY